MATWNGATYLRPQLRSLAKQTLPPAELVVCDDASTDETVPILRRFAEVSSFPVRLFRQGERVGYARNFVNAATHASGELLLFVDQDDVWHPRKVEIVAAASQASGAGVLCHDFEVFESGAGVLLPSFFDHLAAEGLPPEICVKGCATAVRRAFIDQWGWPLGRSGISHDFWLGFLASAVGERAFLPGRLIRHRIHGHNASGWIPTAAGRVPELAAALSAYDPDPTDVMLELVLNPGRQRWIATLQAALRERASAEQTARAERAIGKLGIVDRWLSPTPSGTG